MKIGIEIKKNVLYNLLKSDNNLKLTNECILIQFFMRGEQVRSGKSIVTRTLATLWCGPDLNPPQ